MTKTLIPALATPLLALAVLLWSGTAGANPVAVSITKNGYVPKAVTVAQGGAVQFSNGDATAHQVTFKSTAGVTCTPNPLVLQPGASGSCTFATAGSYSFSDPNVKGSTYRGTVTVTAPTQTSPAPPATTATLAVALQPQAVVYGGKVTLTGVHSSQKAGEPVDILAQPAGQAAAAKVATVQTGEGGAFTALVSPQKNTVYSAKSKSTTSRTLAVKVKPRLQLAKVATGRYTLRVSATTSFAGKYATVQRFNASLGTWVAVQRVALKAGTGGVAPTVVSSAAFGAKLPARTRLRVVLPQLQVGPAYVAGLSNAVLA